MAKAKSLAGGVAADVDDYKPPRLQRGRISKFVLFEVSEEELLIFEKGASSDTFFNFALFLFTLATTAIVTLTVAEFKASITTLIYIVVAVVGILLGIFFTVAWWKTRNPVKDLCKKIRLRLPPDLPAVRAAEAADEADEDGDPPSGEESEPPHGPGALS